MWTLAALSWCSQQIDTRSIQAGQLRYGGKGSVNGVAGYHFMLSAS